MKTLGAKGSIDWRATPIHEYRDLWEIDDRVPQLAWLWQLNRGVFKSPGSKWESWTTSIVMSDEDAERYVENFESFADAIPSVRTRRCPVHRPLEIDRRDGAAALRAGPAPLGAAPRVDRRDGARPDYGADRPDERGRAHRASRAVLAAGAALPHRRARTPALGRAVALRVLGAHRADDRPRHPPGDDAPLPRRAAGRAARVGGTCATGSRRTRRSAATCLRELRREGPLRARDLEDRSADGWHTGGWNDERGRNVAMMLDILWDKGEVMIVGPRRAAAHLGSRRAEPAAR